MEINVENQLFDIRADPNEYNNLAEEYPKLVEIMANKIRRVASPSSYIRNKSSISSSSRMESTKRLDKLHHPHRRTSR